MHMHLERVYSGHLVLAKFTWVERAEDPNLESDSPYKWWLNLNNGKMFSKKFRGFPPLRTLMGMGSIRLTGGAPSSFPLPLCSSHWVGT